MMDCLRIQKGKTHRIYATFVDTAGALKTGLTVSVRIMRKSDILFLKSDATWVTPPGTEYTATALDATNEAGTYYFDFAVPNTFDQYVVRFDGSSSAANRYQYGLAITVNDGNAMIGNKAEQEIGGATHGRVTVYDTDGTTVLYRLTSSKTAGPPIKRILTPS